MREEQVKQAFNFLQNKNVEDKSDDEKRQFLKQKGVTEEEITEAYRRVEPSKAATGTQPTGSQPVAAPATAVDVTQPQVAAPVAQTSSPQHSYSSTQAGLAIPSNVAPQGYSQPWQAQYAGAPYSVPGAPWMSQPPPTTTTPEGDSWPWWVWLAGGVGAGLGGTMLFNPLRQKSPPQDDQRFLAGTAATANGSSVGGLQALPALTNGLSVDNSTMVASAAASLPGSTQPRMGSVPPDPGQETLALSEALGTKGAEEPAGAASKANYEDLVTMLRQQSEEARENSAVFARALQSQQEQYKELFAEMQKVLQSIAQQQKPQKSPPVELSAATIQTLASLMQPAQLPETTERVCSTDAVAGADVTSLAAASAAGVGQGATAPSSGGASSGSVGVPNLPGGQLREMFEAINHNLQRLIRESASKAEAGKLLSTLMMIMQKPERKVNTSSARFATFRDGAPAELLRLAGFQYQEPNFSFSPERSGDSTQHIVDLIQDAQRKLDQTWASRPSSDVCTGGGAATTQGKVPVRPVEQESSVVLGCEDQSDSSVHAPSRMPYAHHTEASSSGQAAWPWASSSVLTQTSRPWASSGVPSQDDRSEDASVASLRASAAQSQPTMAIAHPAESRGWAPGPTMAHPAESEAPPQQPPQHAQQQQQQQQQQQNQLPQQQRQIAHPAEGGGMSEEPQSGG